MSDYNRYKKTAKKIKNQEKANRHINFVVIAYVGILFYIILLIYLSFTKEKVNFVYAEPGIIHDNSMFNGLILKSEQIEYAQDEGPVKYLVTEGSKVRQDTIVCVVNQDPKLEELINKQNEEHMNTLRQVSSMTVDDYHILQDKIREYAIDKHFSSNELVYESKNGLQETIIDISQTLYVGDQELFDKIQQELKENKAESQNNGFYHRIPYSGVVGYTFDGFEEYSIDNFDFSLLNRNVVINDDANREEVKNGEPLYKIIDNHKYYVVAEVDPYADKYLRDKKESRAPAPAYNSLYFPKHNLTIAAQIHDTDYDKSSDKYYAIFQIDRYFDHFFNDRFVDFIIEYEDFEGIKVPNEAVTEQEMLIVPRSAVNFAEGKFIVQKKVYSDDDVSHQGIVPMEVKIYTTDDEYSYIRLMNEDDSLEVGDQVLFITDLDSEESVQEPFAITDSVRLEGVYVINNGYADFKPVLTIYQNETFRIVEKQASYSIRIYDKIAADADEVVEFQTMN